MDLNSKYFDRIRILPAAPRSRPPTQPAASGRAAASRAAIARPRAGGREGQYYNFCLDHVREYNKSYNYFAGMPDDDDRRLPALRRDRPPADLDDGRQPRRSGRRAIHRVQLGGGLHRSLRHFRRRLSPPIRARGASRCGGRCATSSGGPSRALDLDGGETGSRNQGPLQGPGEAAAPRRQWRRPQSPRTACDRSSRPTTTSSPSVSAKTAAPAASRRQISSEISKASHGATEDIDD